mmetsp:Transcript_4530/g.10338  ORF Transcript_4530/g.10338 Transcript_4530/m.10338 type:complete len:137 (-) Transcript_4530:1891-2301(-)
MTLQGRAIRRASIDFGDGKTLPFCPCKRGYMPTKINTNTKTNVKMVACSFHEQARRKRLARERGKLRGGEADPNELFWSKEEAENDNTVYVNGNDNDNDNGDDAGSDSTKKKKTATTTTAAATTSAKGTAKGTAKY